MNKHKEFYADLTPLGDLLGIKLAPLDYMLSVYPDEFMGREFSDEIEMGAANAREEYSPRTQARLIKAFQSHDWKRTSDIYGHNGLSWGGYCKECKRKVKLPEGDKEDWTDDFILAYHFIYGRHKRFGGRITKCKGHK